MSSSHRTAPVPRVCQAKTKCANPEKRSSQPKNTVATIPATGGSMIPRIPVKIIRTLSTIDQLTDFFTITGMCADVTLITFLQSSGGTPLHLNVSRRNHHRGEVSVPDRQNRESKTSE